MGPALLACDWGGTNLRAWTLDAAGRPIDVARFPLGVSRLQPGEAERRFREEVRPSLGAERCPAILSGMIGSNLGWAPAPYAPCPADLPSLAERLLQPAHDVRIVPGVKGPGLAGACDVMRGEETLVLGWVAQDPARAQGRRLVCQPGTHSKWVVVEEGRIVRFVTAMTGELFAVLREHSVLRGGAGPGDGAAFDAGSAAAADGGALAARLFSARARVVGDGADPDTTASYLSGLLIGAEVAGLRAIEGPDGPVVLLGDAELCGWYARALSAAGRACDIHDGEAAALAGLTALARLGGLL